MLTDVYNTITHPFNLLWNWLFALPLPFADRYVIVDVAGGSGKSTLAQSIKTKRPCVVVGMDQCKYGENWQRYPPDVFEQNVYEGIGNKNGFNARRRSLSRRWIVEGVYHDVKMDRQREVFDDLFGLAEVVVWMDIPKLICLFRKAFRSLKRYLGICDQGASRETWSNVKAMLMKGYNNFDRNHRILEDTWVDVSEKSRREFLRVRWPYYYKV